MREKHYPLFLVYTNIKYLCDLYCRGHCRERDPLDEAWVRGSLRERLEDVPKKARSFEHHDCLSLSVHSP